MLLMIYKIQTSVWITTSIYTNTALFSSGINCLVDCRTNFICTVGHLFIFNMQPEVAFPFQL